MVNVRGILIWLAALALVGAGVPVTRIHLSYPNAAIICLVQPDGRDRCVTVGQIRALAVKAGDSIENIRKRKFGD